MNHEETGFLTHLSDAGSGYGSGLGHAGRRGNRPLEKFNVKINIVPDTDGVYETRMESGNLGDIVIWGSDGEEYLTAVEYGMLFDWENENLLADFGPYINEHMQPALEKNRKISGGNVYGFGHNVATSAQDHEAFFYTWDLRWDLYKQLGYPEINKRNH